MSTDTPSTAVRYPPRPARTGALVSVVIPCYNYARYLPDAVNSVLSQRGVEVDVIIVDDASTDNSVAVARSLANGDSRVRIFINEANSGPVRTFNRGLDEVTGEFVVRLDADDLLTPGSLERAVAVMQQLPEVGLVYGHPIHFEGKDRPKARESVDSWTVWRGRDWLTIRCIDGTNSITAPEAVMRASVVERVGGQRELAHAHDMEMWLRMSSVSDVAYVVGVDQAWHREHEGSWSTSSEKPILALGVLRDVFDELFSGHAITIEGGDALHDKALSALAEEALDQVRRQLDRGADANAVRELFDFAEQCSSKVTSGPATDVLRRRAARAASRPRILVRAAGALPRVRRRLRNRARQRRWSRSGEFNRMHIEPGTLSATDGTGAR